VVAVRVALPCHKCGQLAVTVTTPVVPAIYRGFVNGILLTMAPFTGGRLPRSIPDSGDFGDAVTPAQIPAVAGAIEATCASCSADEQADGCR
jgi:hypothetical protein